MSCNEEGLMKDYLIKFWYLDDDIVLGRTRKQAALLVRALGFEQACRRLEQKFDVVKYSQVNLTLEDEEMKEC